MMGTESQQAGFGTELASRAGSFHFIGWPDQEMVGFSYPYTDTNSPPFAALAILAAFEYRNQPGKGQYIDNAQVESSIDFLAQGVLDYSANRRLPQRLENRDPHFAPHGAYRCQGEDRWCAIAVSNDAQWERFCNVIGKPSWAADPKFKTLSDRKKNEDELDRRVECWTAMHPPERVVEMLQGAGIAAALVANSKDLAQDPQLAHRNHYVDLDHSEIGPHGYENFAFRLSKTPDAPRAAAPCLGEHTAYVCTEMLGLSDEEFVQLLTEGVLE